MKKLLMLVAVGVGITFTQCKKYEEDPSITLIPRETRITNTWEFQAAYEDGQNVSSEYDRFDLTIREDGTAYIDVEYESIPGTVVRTQSEGTWTFKDNDEVVELNFDDDSEDAEVYVLRLTLKEFRFRDLESDREIYLRNK